MRKQVLISLLALSIIGGALFLKTTLVSPSASLPADTRISMTITAGKPVYPSCNTKPSSGETCGGAIPSGCTIFTVSKGDRVFFGGNDDSTNPDSYYWVDPGGAQGYGAIWTGTPDNVMQGVNEKGLAYDANGLPSVDVNPHLEREPVTGGYSSYPIQILRECATVEEVIAWVNKHQWHSYMWDQIHFADATGDAVVISVGADGELAFTRKLHGDGYLVSTNFNVANPTNGYGYPCWRYEKATKLLAELVQQEDDLTAQDATAVLNAVHVNGGSSWTLESLIADLPNGIIYLYYFNQFDKPVILNVADELANPHSAGALSRLFPEDVQQEATHRYQQALSKQGLCSQIGKTWVGLTLGSLILLIAVSIKKHRALILWLPVVIILGPLGLLLWLIAGRKQSSWQAALVEATGQTSSATLAYIMMLGVFILSPQAQSNRLLQILFIFCWPLLLGWLFFQGPLLTLAARQSYLRTLGQRLPTAWVTANLGMGGIGSLALRIVKWLTNNCSMMELSIWTVVSIWAAVVVGSVLGLLLNLIFEAWSVHHGYRAWSILAFGEGEVTMPSWRKLWWWILLSLAVLVGGFLVD